MFLQGSELAERFDEHFEIRLAVSEIERQEVFRVRGDVYCHEFHYEPIEKCPGGLEQDEHDAYSIHCLIRHRKLQQTAGCVRLITPAATAPSVVLPFEEHYGGPNVHFVPTARRRISEISRLAVKSQFRKPPLDALSESERQIFPLVTTTLFLALPAIASLTQRSDNYAMMEPRLARLLKLTSGYEFKQVGDLVDYHGIRAAFQISTDAMIANMHPRLVRLYELVKNALSQSFLHGQWDFIGQPAPTYNPATRTPTQQPRRVGNVVNVFG